MKYFLNSVGDIVPFRPHHERSNFFNKVDLFAKVHRSSVDAKCQYGFKLISLYSNGCVDTSKKKFETCPTRKRDIKSRYENIFKRISNLNEIRKDILLLRLVFLDLNLLVNH